MIHSEKFQGHGAAVLCLDVLSQSTSDSSVSIPSSTSTLLLSGSEDGTARLWDLRDHRRRACLCIKIPGGGDILSAVFAPTSPSTYAVLPNDSESAFSKNCSVFLGVENSVLEYDLRHVESPIVFSEPTRNWGDVLQNQDEVNQIALAYYNKPINNGGNCGSKKKKNQKKRGGGGKKRQSTNDGGCGISLYLASCDDAGKTRWTEALQTNPSSGERTSTYENSTVGSTILHHDNHGVAVVPACAFRPIDTSATRGGPSLELVTGGTDCKIQLWDIFRPKKPLSTFMTNQSTNDTEQSKPQVCNPPFVYSLAWSNDGTSLAAGLGDGTVGVFEINNRTLIQSQLLVGTEATDGTVNYAHQSSVASVVYPSFSGSTSDQILCSAGSDGAIVFWNLGKSGDNEWDDIESKTQNENRAQSKDAVSQLFSPRLLQGLRNEEANESASDHKPQILFDIQHGEKINWVTQAAQLLGVSSSAHKDTIFVADTSSDITSYTIPF